MDSGEKRQVAERKERLPGESCSVFILYVSWYMKMSTLRSILFLLYKYGKILGEVKPYR